jgi:hypothetical protein
VRTREDIVERAKLHVGHRETSQNRSPLIDSWLRRCGLGPGYAWCAAFASWCLEDVALASAVKLGLAYPATSRPELGDLMWFRTNHKGNGHVGIVVAGDELTVLCVEGNSDNRVRIVRRLRHEVQFASTREERLELPIILSSDKHPLVPVSFEGTR